MTPNYTHILDQRIEPPADGILSRTIYQDDKLKAVAFGFGQSQELSEHTGSLRLKLSSFWYPVDVRFQRAAGSVPHNFHLADGLPCARY